MQVPDKNASMESLVSTLILSGILPVLTLAASLCTNHSLYYQGYTNLPQTASILSWRMFPKTTVRKHYEHVCASVRHFFEQTVICNDWLMNWGFGWHSKGGGGRRWGQVKKWKIRSFLSFLVTHSPCSFYWPECLLFHCVPLMLTNEGHRLNPNV